MLNLIPKPASILPSQGVFALSSSTHIHCDSSDQEATFLADYLSMQLQKATGLHFATTDTGQGTPGIILQLDIDPGLGEEGYELSITTDQIRLYANHPAGLFYAIQTLLQLIPTHPAATFSLPAVSIRDTPRFVWRDARCGVSFLRCGGCQALH